jgi:hypothetical protein
MTREGKADRGNWKRRQRSRIRIGSRSNIIIISGIKQIQQMVIITIVRSRVGSIHKAQGCKNSLLIQIQPVD